jgi:hypothetical protein
MKLLTLIQVFSYLGMHHVLTMVAFATLHCEKILNRSLTTQQESFWQMMGLTQLSAKHSNTSLQTNSSYQRMLSGIKQQHGTITLRLPTGQVLPPEGSKARNQITAKLLHLLSRVRTISVRTTKFQGQEYLQPKMLCFYSRLCFDEVSIL